MYIGSTKFNLAHHLAPKSVLIVESVRGETSRSTFLGFTRRSKPDDDLRLPVHFHRDNTHENSGLFKDETDTRSITTKQQDLHGCVLKSRMTS